MGTYVIRKTGNVYNQVTGAWVGIVDANGRAQYLSSAPTDGTVVKETPYLYDGVTGAWAGIVDLSGRAQIVNAAASNHYVTHYGADAFDVTTGAWLGALDLYNRDTLAGSASDGYDVVLVAGQSNMAGRGTFNAGIDTTNANVFQFDGNAASGTYRTIITAIDPLKHPEASSTAVGPAMFFAKRYNTLTSRKVLLVPAAWGGTALIGGTWAPAGRDYLNAIDQANRAITAATAALSGSRFVGTIWLQGESDGANLVAQNTYQTALLALIAGFRSSITGASSSWFVIGQMMPEAIAAQGGTYAAIDAAHTVIGADAVRTTRVAIGAGFNSGDNLHYNAAGARLMGTTMGDGVAAAAANAGAAQPAQVTGLTVGTTTSTTAPLTWSAVSGARDYEVQWSPAGAGSWTTFSDGYSTATSATVTGLTASTAYDFRVRAVNLGPNSPGAYSTTATGTTAALPANVFPRLTTITGSLVTEGGNGTTGWTYTTATGSAFTADHAGTSSLKLPAGVDGNVRTTIPNNNSSNSVILGLVTSQADPAYNAGASGYKFGVINHPASLFYRVIVDGVGTSVVPTLPSVGLQNGDIVRIARTGGNTITAQVARSASPTVWIDIHVFAATYSGDLWCAVAFSNTSGVAQTAGPFVAENWA